MEYLTFFEWLAERDNEGDPPDMPKSDVAWAKNEVRNMFWLGKHGGDCTDAPHTCDLCLLESLLKEYREYRFNGKESKD